MRKYRFIGKSNEYAWNENPINGRDYSVSEIIKLRGFNTSEEDMIHDTLEDILKNDWIKIVDLETDSSFEDKVIKVLNDIGDTLIEKNRKYGNAALNPVRIFSKASSTEQIKVRLDDKLSRLRTQDIEEDEDVLKDLMGYLVLFRIAKDNKDV